MPTLKQQTTSMVTEARGFVWLFERLSLLHLLWISCNTPSKYHICVNVCKPRLWSCVVVGKEFIRPTRQQQHCHIHPQTSISSTSGSLWRCSGAHKLSLLRMSARKGTSCVLGYRLSRPIRIRLMTGHCRDDHLSATKEKNGANATIVRSGQLPSSSPAPSTRHVIPSQVGHSFRSCGWTPRRKRALYKLNAHEYLVESEMLMRSIKNSTRRSGDESICPH